MIKPVRFNSTLLAKEFATPSILHLTYSVPEDFQMEIGQYANIAVTAPFRRPYSIVEHRNNTITFMIEVREPGKGSDYCKAAQVGDVTEIMAPLGRFGLQTSNDKKIFICTGVGLAPFVGMIKKLTEEKIQSELYFGMRGIENEELVQFYLKNELQSGLVKYTRCVTGEPKTDLPHLQGRVTEIISNNNFDFTTTEFYICGSNQMVKDTRSILLEKGSTKVFIENYG